MFLILKIVLFLVFCNYLKGQSINNFKLSRSLKNSPSFNQPKIQYENYKALLGETVRLECPQPNPTWFFRRLSSEDSASNNVEDIIVTRHGVINSDYKYKIMCHMTLKHKVIIINNIDFDEEGLYTCLYTLSLDQSSKSNGVTYDLVNNPVQFRYVFNVTVYSLLSGLKMNFESTKSATQPNLKKNEDQYELIENSLTVKENEEFTLKCIVESSKPAADIKFSIKNEIISKDEIPSLNNNQISSFLTLPPLTPPTTLASLLSEESKILKNNDFTYKTMHTIRMKASRLDQGKMISCLAENGFSNQKWETKKTLNVLFAPVCRDAPNFVYYVGINNTVNIECRILNANPSKIVYEWNLDKIRRSSEFKISEHYELAYKNEFLLNSDNIKGYGDYSTLSPINFNTKRTLIHFQNDELVSSFKWRPTDIEQFGQISCKASNEVGSTECKYEIKLGGVPNPPTDCTYTLKNSSAIISCIVGFHQGDPDIYCYLLKKSENGVYKEHTRNRESCSFIVNDVNIHKLNEFWIYSSNKHGHNKDLGFHLSIGQAARELEPEKNKNMILIGIVSALFVFCIAACCFCFRIKKGLTDDNESYCESDPYRTKSIPNGSFKGKLANDSEKMIKGLKVMNQSNYSDEKDISSKYLNHDNYMDKMTSINGYLQVSKNDDYENKILLYQERKKSLTLNKKKSKIESDDSDIKKSISFFDDISGSLSDEVKLIKETNSLLKKSEKQNTKGLLKPVDDSSSKNSSNSLNESNPNNSSKMVTFSKNICNPSLKKNANTNQSIGTLENHTNTTVSTSVSSSSTESSASPNPYSSNDSDSIEQPSINANKLTVSDQSFNIQTNLFLKNSKFNNRLSTFSDSSSKPFRSPRRFIDSQEGLPSPPSSPKQENSLLNSQEYSSKLSDSFETKFLNKLCEEIEVSLNVDSECADDYSMNDFSGDYSFDNGYKTPIYSSVPNRQISTPNPSQNLTETKKNFEQNVRGMRFKNQPRNNSASSYSSFSQNKNSTEIPSSSSKNQLGVLV